MTIAIPPNRIAGIHAAHRYRSVESTVNVPPLPHAPRKIDYGARPVNQLNIKSDSQKRRKPWVALASATRLPHDGLAIWEPGRRATTSERFLAERRFAART